MFSILSAHPTRAWRCGTPAPERASTLSSTTKIRWPHPAPCFPLFCVCSDQIQSDKTHLLPSLVFPGNHWWSRHPASDTSAWTKAIIPAVIKSWVARREVDLLMGLAAPPYKDSWFYCVFSHCEMTQNLKAQRDKLGADRTLSFSIWSVQILKTGSSEETTVLECQRCVNPTWSSPICVIFLCSASFSGVER